jgi:hypothetical protein
MILVNQEIKKDIDFLRKHTLQPAWWKIAKIFILVGGILTIWKIFGILKTIIWFSIILVLGSIVHFMYRIKTKTYQKIWMDFNVKEIDGKLTYGRIGMLYYSLVILIFFIATITIILL